MFQILSQKIFYHDKDDTNNVSTTWMHTSDSAEEQMEAIGEL